MILMNKKTPIQEIALFTIQSIVDAYDEYYFYDDNKTAYYRRVKSAINKYDSSNVVSVYNTLMQIEAFLDSLDPSEKENPAIVSVNFVITALKQMESI